MYSPKINAEFIPILYRLGKANKKPMTKVVNEIIGRALREMEKIKKGGTKAKTRSIDNE